LFPDLSFFPQEEKESTIALSSRVAETTRKKKTKKNTHSGGSLVSFSLLLLFSRERRSAFSLSLSLSLSLCSREKRRREKLLSSGEISILARSFYLKKLALLRL
jgi:hypothetical protein